VDGKGERGRYTRKYSEKVGGVGGEGEGEVYFYISEFVSVLCWRYRRVCNRRTDVKGLWLLYIIF
jgi:hypothetical protein